MTDPTTTPLPFHAVDVAALSPESNVAVECMHPGDAARHAVRNYRKRLLANNPDLVLAGEPETPAPPEPKIPAPRLRTITLFQNPVPPDHTHKADWTILEDGVLMDRLDAMEMMWALQHSLIAGTTPPRWPQGSIDGIIERSRREGERNVRNNIQQEYYEAMAGSGQNEAAPNFKFKTAPIAMPELHFGNNGKLRAVRLKDGVLAPIKAPTPPRKPRTAAALIDSMVAPRPSKRTTKAKGDEGGWDKPLTGARHLSTARRARTPAKFKKTPAKPRKPAKKPTKR